MQYKSIVLELLQDRPAIHDRLRREWALLAAVERYAQELKVLHEVWKETLSEKNPARDPPQLAKEALELALKDLMEVLPAEQPPDNGVFSLDTAMASLRRPTSND